MEKLGLYNKRNIATGEWIERGQKPTGDNYVKLTVVWLKCGDKYLIQNCSEEKGGEYAVTGGHVPFGIDSFDQACIETEEELGLKLDKDKLKPLGMLVMKNAMFDTYIYEDETLKDFNFVLQESEVDSVHFFTKAEIEYLINKGLFRKSSEKQFKAFIKDRD